MKPIPGSFQGTPRHVALIFYAAVLFIYIAIAIFGSGREPFDYHNFRQCQTLSTIQNFAREGVDMLHPKTNYQGEPGTFVLEFPLYQAAAAHIFLWSGESLSNVRLLNVTFAVGCSILIVLLGRQLSTPSMGWFAGGIYLAAPLSLYYNGAILIDHLAVFLSLTALYGLYRLLYSSPEEKFLVRATWTALFLIFGCLTALMKVLYLFPSAALFGIYILEERKRLPRVAVTLLVLFACGVPMLILVGLWQLHALKVNAGSPFTQGISPATLLGISDLGESKWYRVILKRLFTEYTGTLGFILAVTFWIAQVAAGKKKNANPTIIRLASITFASSIGYLLFFANINFPHNYYGLLLVPFLALASAAGLETIFAWSGENKLAAVGCWTIVVLCVTIPICTFISNGYHPQNTSMVNLASAASTSENSSYKTERYTIALVSEDKSPGGAAPHEAPALLYALGLRGSGFVVKDSAQGSEYLKQLVPLYQNLRYIATYGLVSTPADLPSSKVIFQDKTNHLVIYELSPPPTVDLP